MITDPTVPSEEDLARARRDLRALVAIPSVSADQDVGRGDADQVRRSADRVRDLAAAAGAESAEVLSVPGGRPAVIATWPAPAGAPTVLLYAHHDVQPAGPLEDWSSDPFEARQADGRIFGRGAADDKAGVVAHLTAVRAHGGRPPVGVTLFVEGEEEVGSPTFEAFLDAHRDALRADVIVVADSSNWSTTVPALTTTLRGVVVCDVEVRTLQRQVHSGLAGGAAPDALMVLVRVLDSLTAEDGSVAVAGLHQDADPSVDYPEDRFREEAALLDGVALIGDGPLAARLWTRPSITVVGIDAPSTEAAAMVLAAHARARVSMRVAPGQDTHEALRLLRDHVVSHTPWGAEVTVTAGAAGPSTRLDLTSPVADVARAALADAFDGVAPVEVGVGGSIPFITTLSQTYSQATVLVTGVGDPQSNWHGPDESMDLATLDRICRFEADLLSRLATTAG